MCEGTLALVRFADANIKFLRNHSNLLLLGLTPFVKVEIAGKVVSEIRGEE